MIQGSVGDSDNQVNGGAAHEHPLHKKIKYNEQSYEKCVMETQLALRSLSAEIISDKFSEYQQQGVYDQQHQLRDNNNCASPKEYTLLDNSGGGFDNRVVLSPQNSNSSAGSGGGNGGQGRGVGHGSGGSSCGGSMSGGE